MSTCQWCGGTGWKVTADSHGLSFSIGVDPCDCSPFVDIPADFADLVAAAVVEAVIRLTGGPSEIGRLRVENAELRADLYAARRGVA